MSLSVRLTRKFRPAADSAGFALHVEFTADRGITVLFGPSGAGKSLTLNCIAGFEKPDSGRIMLGDRILFDAEARVNLRPRDRHCGYVFQSHALFPHMTVRENLMFAAERHPRLERHRLVTEMLERFALTEMAGRKPANLSGGQNQRCSIARALITSPRALLLDEPAAGLDVSLRSELSDVLKQVREDLEIPLLLVTHDVDDAMTLADQVLVYTDGGIVQRGSADSIRTHPANADVARMFGPTNVLDAEILALDPGRNSSRVRINGTELNARYLPGHFRGDRIRMNARADELIVHGSRGENRMELRLERMLARANFIELRFTPELVVFAPRHDWEKFRDGREWYVEFPPDSLRPLGEA
jgi:molybdate transport system ATP-binding protein